MLRRTENAKENVDRNRNQEGGVMAVVVVAVMVMVFIRRCVSVKGTPNPVLYAIIVLFNCVYTDTIAYKAHCCCV